MICGKCLTDTIPDEATMNEYCPNCGEIINACAWHNGDYANKYPTIRAEIMRRYFAFVDYVFDIVRHKELVTYNY